MCVQRERERETNGVRDVDLYHMYSRCRTVGLYHMYGRCRTRPRATCSRATLLIVTGFQTGSGPTHVARMQIL